MDIKQIENLELLVSKMKENNSPYLEQFPSLAAIDFAAVKAGTKKLSSYITDARLVEIAGKLNISVDNKSREDLLKEVVASIQSKLAEKGFLKKIAFWKKK